MMILWVILVAFYAHGSSCLAPLCAASGQLLIQGMLTEASCRQLRAIPA